MLEAEGIAQLPPGHELVKKLPAAIAAVAHQVSRNLERRDHAKVVVCCSHAEKKCPLLSSIHQFVADGVPQILISCSHTNISCDMITA